ncbi:MAG: 30S ribosomal protein S13 [Weeksellaceae bacterium]
MLRIVGIILPDQRRIDYALTTLYGVGWTRSKKILTESGIAPETRVKDITEEEVKKLMLAIEKKFKIEGDLREEKNENIKRLREIGSYRGMRHAQGLPVHGQRTRSNARTKKGKRKTVGALTKEAWAKMEQQKTSK